MAYTNLTAIEAGIELANAAGNAELASKFAAMADAMERSRKNRGKYESAEQRHNREVLMPAIVSAMAKEENGVTAMWITEHVNGVPTTQKATALLGKLIDDGTVGRFKNGSKTLFRLI